MNTTEHRVQRQIIEVTVRDRHAASSVQTRVSTLQKRHLMRDLARVLDRVAPSDHLLRIERLALDLGTIPSSDLELQLRSRLQEKLASRVSSYLEAQTHASSRAEDVARESLALVEQLLQHGSLPWWADPMDRTCFDAHLKQALEHTPREATQLLRRCFGSTTAAKRAALHAHPRTLGWVVETLQPGCGAHVRTTANAIVRASVLPRHRPSLRVALWQAVLRVSALDVQPRLSYWHRVISQLASDQGIAVSVQLAQLAARGPTDDLLKTLCGQQPTARSAGDSTDQQLARLASISGRTASLSASLRAALRGEPTTLALSIRTFLASVTSNRVGELTTLVSGLRQQVARAGGSPAQALAKDLERWLARAQADLVSGRSDSPAGRPRASANAPAVLEADARVVAEGSAAVHSMASSDTVEVMNAGLVLLWPFLRTLFDRMGLLQGEVFRDEAASDQAIALLHYLGTANASPPEYQLPLNKLLCGRHLHEPWSPTPWHKEARTECDALLRAVIERAEAFGALSPQGLRGTFLLRRGTLRPDPTGWLLRVERETVDVLTDRLPWPFAWVRLPWMPAPLQVEW